MRMLIAGFLVVFILVFAYYGFTAIRDWIKSRKFEYGDWELKEVAEHGQMFLYAVKPGAERLLVCSPIDFAAVDFDAQLWEGRAEAREKIFALNEKEKALM